MQCRFVGLYTVRGTVQLNVWPILGWCLVVVVVVHCLRALELVQVVVRAGCLLANQ